MMAVTGSPRLTVGIHVGFTAWQKGNDGCNQGKGENMFHNRIEVKFLSWRVYGINRLLIDAETRRVVYSEWQANIGVHPGIGSALFPLAVGDRFCLVVAVMVVIVVMP